MPLSLLQQEALLAQHDQPQSELAQRARAALRIHVVGVAAGTILKDGEPYPEANRARAGRLIYDPVDLARGAAALLRALLTGPDADLVVAFADADLQEAVAAFADLAQELGL